MIGEKFYQNVSALSNTELNSCIRFSKVELNNKRLEITQTLEAIKKNKNKFFLLLSDEKKLFFFIFPEKKQFNKKDLADHFYYCMTLLENFILHNVVLNNKELRLEILEKFYMERGVEKEFLSLNKKRIKIEKSKKVSLESYFNLYLLNNSKFYFSLSSFDNDVFEIMNEAIKHLDRFYFLSKMTAFQLLSSNSLVNNVEYEHVLKKEITEIIRQDAVVHNDVLYKIYNITSQLYENDFDKERFYLLKKMILDNKDIFGLKLLKNLFVDLNNYLSYLYDKEADNSLIKEVFEINKLKIVEMAMLENNNYPGSAFKQDIRIAIYLKEYDWAENFVNKYSKYVVNKELVTSVKCEILYSKGNYKELYKLVDQLMVSNNFNEFDIKSLYAKALFDEKKFDVLEPFLTNFTLSLRRQKENYKNALSSRISFVLALQKMMKHFYNNARLIALRKELEENKEVQHRNWLFLKLNSMLKHKL